jgi:D-3-phosphoglycerate dehydrogenase
MDACPSLEHISRVGVGLDSVDLQAARERDIRVSYTPDAPAPAVAELTIALMLSLLRSVHIANNVMHKKEWRRIFGRRLAEVTVGVIGLGRIGGRVLNRTKGFGTPRILANDIEPNSELGRHFKLEWVTKDKLLRESDIVTLHVPLTRRTKNLITKDDLLSMKNDAFIVNTSRGGVINEQDLFDVMAGGHLGGAAIDVFEQEPYSGPLSKIERCILTSHMGSMSVDCRTRMEIEATRETVRYLSGYSLESAVPEEEYEVQAMFKSVANA